MGRAKVGTAVATALTALTAAVLLGVVANRLTPPPVRVAAAEDTFALTAEPGVTAGNQLFLAAGGLYGGAAISYLKFDVVLPPGRLPLRTWLWLGRHSGPLPELVELSQVSNTAWREATITGSSAPRLGAVVGSVAPRPYDRAVAFDVTRIIRASGTYSFAVTSPTSSELAHFVAREAIGTATGAPTITFEWPEVPVSSRSAAPPRLTAPATPSATSPQLSAPATPSQSSPTRTSDPLAVRPPTFTPSSTPGPGASTGPMPTVSPWPTAPSTGQPSPNPSVLPWPSAIASAGPDPDVTAPVPPAIPPAIPGRPSAVPPAIPPVVPSGSPAASSVPPVPPGVPPVVPPGVPPVVPPGVPPVVPPGVPPGVPTGPAIPPGVPSRPPALPTSPSAVPTRPPAVPSGPPAVSSGPPAVPSVPPTTPSAPPQCAIGPKLVPSCGVLWGVAPGAHTKQDRAEALIDFETRVGRPQVIYHAYHRGSELFPTAQQIKLARDPARPRMLFLNWKPVGARWSEIARGHPIIDAQLDRLAAHIKTNFREQFFFTVHHEPENDVRPFPGSGMTAQDYAAAFRYVMTRLRAAGVTNLVSTMSYMAFVPWNTKSWFEELYPGDDVVDWVAWDTYAYSVPGYGHGDFAEMLNRRTASRPAWPGFYNWAARRFPNKPLMLGEWGVWYARSHPEHQAAFYDSARLQLESFPRLKAVVYFESPNAEGRDSRVHVTPNGLQSFQRFSQHPAFDIPLRPSTSAG